MTTILIDGLNVVRAIFDFDHSEDRREAWEREEQHYSIFLAGLKRLSRRDRRINALNMEVYFDGKPRQLAKLDTVALSYTCTGWQSADDKIVERIGQLSGKVVVMTFDSGLARRARAAGAHVISPRWLFRTARDYNINFYQFA
jgi:hypothetical protein